MVRGLSASIDTSLRVFEHCQPGVHVPDAGRDRSDVFLSDCGGGGWRAVASVGRRAGVADRQRVWSMPNTSY